MICVGDKITFSYMDGTNAGVYIVTSIFYNIFKKGVIIEIATPDGKEQFSQEEIELFKLKKVG